MSGASLALAILQSICTAVLTINGIRLGIGLTAFVLASSMVGPVQWFHQDAIRIPMLIIATIGAIVDLAVLWWTHRLRTRSAAQWRRRELSGKEKRSQRLQFALAVVTLVLVGTEAYTHAVIFHPAHRRTHSPQAHVTVLPASSNNI
jgi:cytochrome b subunit of formate dehydrogenase